MTARLGRPAPGAVSAAFRSSFLVPLGWLTGVTAGAALVWMPAAGGPVGLAAAAASVVLALALMASVLVVAAALVAPVVSRLAGRARTQGATAARERAADGEGGS